MIKPATPDIDNGFAILGSAKACAQILAGLDVLDEGPYDRGVFFIPRSLDFDGHVCPLIFLLHGSFGLSSR